LRLPIDGNRNGTAKIKNGNSANMNIEDVNLSVTTPTNTNYTLNHNQNIVDDETEHERPFRDGTKLSDGNSATPVHVQSNAGSPSEESLLARSKAGKKYSK